MQYFTLNLVLFACVCTAHSVSNSSSANSSNASKLNANNTEIYNVCPAAIDFTKEQDQLSEEELKGNAADAAMSAFLLSHPNNTLWDYFKIEQRQKWLMFENLSPSGKIKSLARNFVNFAADTAINIAQMIADAIEWIINTIRHPVVGTRQVIDFFKDFGKNVKLLWGLMKDDPKETSKNMGGGLLLHIMHHPTEFTADTLLTVTTGFAVIHGLMHGVEAIFGAMSNAVSNVLLSVLLFIHAIDDPILIVTPLIRSMVETTKTVFTDGNSTTPDVLTLSPYAIKPLKSCKIPEKYRPEFSSRDLCLSTPAEIRNLLFGTAKRTAKMTRAERITAYNRFHDFVCCYLKDQGFVVNAPSMNSTAFRAELVPVHIKMTNCSQLLATYNADTFDNF